LSRGNFEQKSIFISPGICATCHLAILPPMWYNLYCQGAVSLVKVWVANTKQTTTEKLFQNYFENLLTTPPLCDIMSMFQEGIQNQKKRK
jgi:hypothetical protein